MLPARLDPIGHRKDVPRRAGTTASTKDHWNVRAGGETTVIELSDMRFARLYLSVGDVVERINAAITV